MPLGRQRQTTSVSGQETATEAPQQIAGWLKLQYPDDDTMQVSHETIYRNLFIQARGVLKAELMKHLRTRWMMRRSKKASTKGQLRGQIIDPRAPRRSRRPRDSRSLGRRLAERFE